MDKQPSPVVEYKTQLVDEVWYSLAPSVLPPDDSGRPWVDLHRHHEDGTVVLGRFPSQAAAITWAWRHQGVAPDAWAPANDAS
jgi:hypothetical protein